MEPVSLILLILTGLVLLFAGRRYLWLAAALSIFLFLVNLFQNLFGGGLLSLIIAIIAAVVLAWLALKFAKIIGYVIGALAGAAGLPVLLGLLGITWNWWLLALIGAVLGVLLVALVLDWGLILVTAWAGANVVAANVAKWLSLDATLSTVIFVVLMVAGVLVQGAQLRSKK